MKTMIDRYSILSLVLLLGMTTTLFSQEKPFVLPSANEAAELSALLKDPNAGYYKKMMACKQVAAKGTDASIPVLISYLNDPKLSHNVRIALVQLPGEKAGRALCESLKTINRVELLPGAIRTIGKRRESFALPYLIPFLERKEINIFRATCEAIGSLGGSESTAALVASWNKSDAGHRNILAPALFDLVYQFEKAKQPDQGTAICRLMFQTKEILPQYRQTALVQLIRLSQGKEKKTYFKTAFDSDQKEMFAVALQTIRQFGSSELVPLFQAEFEKYDLKRKQLVFDYVKTQRANELTPLLLKLATSNGDVTIRNAALDALSAVANVSHAPALFKSTSEATKGDWSVVVAHLMCLGTINDPKLDELVLDMLKKNEGPFRDFMINLAELRRIKAGESIYLAELTNASPNVRKMARNACVAVMPIDKLPSVIDLYGKVTPEMKPELFTLVRDLVQSTHDKEKAARLLLDRFTKMDVNDQKIFVEAIMLTQTKRAMDALLQLALGPEPALCNLATQYLGNWSNEAAGVPLLTIAQKTTDPKLRIRAIRGYLRIIRQMRIAPWRKIEMANGILPLIERPDERNLWIESVGRITAKPAMDLIKPYLEKEETREIACASLVSIAKSIDMNDPDVQAVLKTVSEKSKKPETKTEANDLLKGIVVKTRK